MYYEKISILYGESSNRPITPTYPAEGVDLQPLSNEFEIVSVSEVAETGISSIKAGDGVTATILVTVDLANPIDGIEINDLIEIDGVSDSRYNGRFVVDTVLAQNDFGVTRFTYKTLVAPDNALPTPSGSFFTLSVDTINSPIPKISKVCVKSSYGLSGLFFDGDKIGGTKQTTVIGFDYESFQNDNNAFIRYNSSSGTFDDSTSVSNLHSDSSAKFKPDFYNYGVKATNDVEIELDSCAFTGAYQHICSENGARVFSRSGPLILDRVPCAQEDIPIPPQQEKTLVTSLISSLQEQTSTTPSSLSGIRLMLRELLELVPPPDFIFTMRQTSPVHLSQHFRVITLVQRIMTS